MLVIAKLKNSPSKWQTVSIILWISFLLSIVATGISFSLIDPEILSNSVGLLNYDRITIYSIGFFVLWLFSFCSAYISCLFLKSN